MPPGRITHRISTSHKGEERVTDGRSSPHPGRKRQKRPGYGRARSLSLMRRRYAGRAAQSTLGGALPGHVLSSHCAPDCAAHGGALASAEAFEPTATDGLTAPRSSRMLRVGFRSID